MLSAMTAAAIEDVAWDDYGPGAEWQAIHSAEQKAR
jgi:hypothetical protein